MAPPGRRKPFALSILPLLVLFLFAVNSYAASAALGIDFGTEYIKAAVAKPGSPIEIVLTKDSKRKEAATIAFKPSRAQNKDKDAFPERLYGGDAIAVSARYPADTYSNLKTLLGLTYENPLVRQYGRRFPGLQMEKIQRENASASTVGFKSYSLGQSEALMVEELLGMELKNIKANAEAAIGKSNYIQGVVITYPSFYTAEERRALELAADFAGLNLLGLISDGQAVGLNYATTRASTPEDEYHVVYDMGAGSTTASVLKFHNKIVKGSGKKNQTVQEVQVVGTGYDRSLGGDALNDMIVADMIEKFLEMPKIKTMGVEDVHVRKDGKSMARLWKDAEKLRQILSANTQASTSLEGFFYEDVSFKYKLTRYEFEAMSNTYALRIGAPLSAALTVAGLTLDDISSIILFGGLTRTPFVQTQLEKAAKDAHKVKTNINADEAAAFGAAFRAAGLSPSFRVKDIRIADISGKAYTMKWTADGKERQQKVFLETSQIGVTKQVVVKSLESLTLQFEQTSISQDDSHNIFEVEATNLTKSANELKTVYGCADTNITTVFNVRLSPLNGLPEVVSASVSCVAQKGKDASVMDKAKGLFGFGKQNDQKPLVDEDSLAEEELLSQTPEPIDDPTSSGTIVSATSSEVKVESSSSSSAAAKQTPSTIVIPLALKSNTIGPGAAPKKAMPSIKQRLSAFDRSDQNAMLRSEALNVLEAFTYRARDYLEDDSFTAFSTDQARAELKKQLSAASEWLYGDGVDAKLQDFKEKLKSLKTLVDPVLKRKDESSGRDKAIEALQSSLTSASTMMDSIKESIEKSAKKASSSVSSAASAVSSDASSVVSAVISGGDDLEDEPYATIDVDATETEIAAPKLYEYTEDDLSTIEKAYTSLKSWLEEKLALQGKLSPYDDPAFLVADLEAKGKQLQSTVSDLIMKQIKMQIPPKSKKPKRSSNGKNKKTKSEQGATSTVEADSSASFSSSSSTATASTSATLKDEL